MLSTRAERRRQEMKQEFMNTITVSLCFVYGSFVYVLFYAYVYFVCMRLSLCLVRRYAIASEFRWTVEMVLTISNMYVCMYVCMYTPAQTLLVDIYAICQACKLCLTFDCIHTIRQRVRTLRRKRGNNLNRRQRVWKLPSQVSTIYLSSAFGDTEISTIIGPVVFG